MSTYSILNAGRIVAGPDSIEQIADIVKDYGASRALIISDKGVARAGLIERPKALLEAAGTGRLRGVLLYGVARPSMQPEAPRISTLTVDELEAIAGRARKKGLTVRVSP